MSLSSTVYEKRLLSLNICVRVVDKCMKTSSNPTRCRKLRKSLDTARAESLKHAILLNRPLEAKIREASKPIYLTRYE